MSNNPRQPTQQTAADRIRSALSTAHFRVESHGRSKAFPGREMIRITVNADMPDIVGRKLILLAPKWHQPALESASRWGNTIQVLDTPSGVVLHNEDGAARIDRDGEHHWYFAGISGSQDHTSFLYETMTSLRSSSSAILPSSKQVAHDAVERALSELPNALALGGRVATAAFVQTIAKGVATKQLDEMQTELDQLRSGVATELEKTKVTVTAAYQVCAAE